jgi:hypothetical protein
MNAGKRIKAGIAERGFFRAIGDILSGNFLAREYSWRQAPFVFFLSFIGIIYIANSYYAEKNIRKINKYSEELKELRSEYITSKSRLMFLGRQSEISRISKEKGLNLTEATAPPGKIIVESQSPAENEKD